MSNPDLKAALDEAFDVARFAACRPATISALRVIFEVLRERVDKAIDAPTEAAAMAATVPAPEHCLPLGAIVNGKTCIDRLERDYAFQCDAGPLAMCADWDMLKRCFFHLAEHAQEIAQRDPDPAVGWPGTQAPVADQPADASPAQTPGFESLRLWWTMYETQWELCDERPEDGAVVLQFMGSGASHTVTAGEIRQALNVPAAPKGDSNG